MTLQHPAPDGGMCHVLPYGRHGVVRVFGCVSWEAVGLDTCPTPTTPGRYECYACGVSGVTGDAFAALQHSQTCGHPSQ
ncbi:hypothetical protein [Nonomuraea sp. NPDC049784]|uniref:hypothetical protein n=1 Tax=Nonomuraea sp. NPDC049784 TaxID=3154361 RepID=UPI0033CAF28A